MKVRSVGAILAVLVLALGATAFSNVNATGGGTQSVRAGDVFNNPFLEEEVKKLLERAIDRIVQERITAIRSEIELKYKQQLAQLELRNLELQEKILELKKKIKELERELAGETREKIEVLRVRSIMRLGNRIILTLEDGTKLEAGKRWKNYVVVKIDLVNRVVYLKTEYGEVIAVNYVISS